MIIREIVEINGKSFIHSYSDENFYIRKLGTDEVYSEAYDLPEKKYTYEETEDKVAQEELDKVVEEDEKPLQPTEE